MNQYCPECGYCNVYHGVANKPHKCADCEYFFIKPIKTASKKSKKEVVAKNLDIFDVSDIIDIVEATTVPEENQRRSRKRRK